MFWIGFGIGFAAAVVLALAFIVFVSYVAKAGNVLH